ncbi:MAG: hypothetical protein K5925_00680 [Bacilli bacterium]|nr:hypothetical protein [Bacilli bacterium]
MKVKRYLFPLIASMLLLGGCGNNSTASTNNNNPPSENDGSNNGQSDGGNNNQSGNNNNQGSGGNNQGQQSQGGDNLPTDKRYKTYYQLLVYSFADSNNDGIGDFKGIVDKLDYLVNLGVEGIWLSPVLESKSYHAYDVTNYYKINPSYEVTISNKKYDYKYLLDECHKKGISVLMDLVLNHTSTSHDWYRDHRNWYSGKNVFGDAMPDLDYSKTEVQNAVIEVGKYWLNQGFDGYRLDAAMWLYNSSGGTNASSVDHEKNYEYWNKWCGEMKKVNKDAYIIGEVLNYDHDKAFEYAYSGFDSTFNFNVRTQIENAVKNKGYDYVSAYNNDLDKVRRISDDFILGRPLSNHDVGRFTSYHKGMSDESAHYVTSFEDIRLANALNILTPGNAFIYYGDELGLKGTCDQGWDDMAFRTPMPFGTERTNSQTYFQGFKGDGRTTSVTLSGKTAEQDMADNNSLYKSLSTLINIKKKHNAINEGDMSKISGLNSDLSGFKLTDGKEDIYVVYNVSGSSVNYSIPSDMKLLYSNDPVTNNSVSLSNKSFVLYVK